MHLILLHLITVIGLTFVWPLLNLNLCFESYKMNHDLLKVKHLKMEMLLLKNNNDKLFWLLQIVLNLVNQGSTKC